MESFQGYLTGHVGAITGGDHQRGPLDAGVSVAVHEDTGWGAEFDFGHTADVLAGRQILDVTTYMVNMAFVKPDGRIRPFAIAGAGILQVNGCDSPCNVAARTYDFGINVGGGAFFVLTDYVGPARRRAILLFGCRSP